MAKYSALIAAALGILSVIAIWAMYYAFNNSGGMAVLLFQIWGVFAAFGAIGLALTSRFLAKPPAMAPKKLSAFAIVMGILSMIALLAAYLIYG